MDMQIISTQKEMCISCMEEHEVKEVLVPESSTFKNTKISYDAHYMYCDKTDELCMNEHQVRENNIHLKEAYRKVKGLLSAEEIVAIRKKYKITQSDLCILLGWGEKTITRYESYQVQDKAHDTILRKIDRDPEWFISLLNAAKDNLSDTAYQKYLTTATHLYEEYKDSYLRKAIEAGNMLYTGNKLLNGNVKLDLNKVVDVIRYFSASQKITKLYKVKLMKLMWYADALSYKKRGYAITGLVYRALPMGAVPIGHEFIINLKGVPCEDVDIEEMNAYHFSLKEQTSYSALSSEDKAILDCVIDKLGAMTKNEIVAFMHQEDAYQYTDPWEVIPFNYTENLKI